MGKRRLVTMSDDEEEDAPPPPPSRKKPPANTVEDEEEEDRPKRKKPKPKPIPTEEEEEEDRPKRKKSKTIPSDEEEEEEREDEEEGEEEAVPDARAIGDVVRVSGKGRGRKNHFSSFEYDALRYDLEDPVLLSPEEADQKPYVAIIKDIYQKIGDESLMVTGQWFYRPEEAEKKSGGNWISTDTRELFYSFHRDDIPAESVMHKCVVHFVPRNKQIPYRKLHPGFFVQKVYDTELRRLFKLTDKDYEDNKQEEIDILVNKTIDRIGDLLDTETDNSTSIEQEDQWKSKRLQKKRNMSNLDVSRDDDEVMAKSSKPDTPRSVANNTSEYYTILSKFEALTSDGQRDKWLERLLQGVQFICNHAENGNTGANASHEKCASDETIFVWPDTVVPGITTLEKVVHEVFSSDFTKYNQKMRQLLFNLKNNSVLATRLLKGELEPSKILSMSPAELKEGLTREELASKQPEKPASMQMIEARCKRCSEKKVGLLEIIQAGHGARYQLECPACGYTWYASRDEVTSVSLTIEMPNSLTNVGTAPLATAKFENVEKKMVSPRGGESNKAEEMIKKTTEAYMPTLETQKSFKKPKDA